MFGFEFWDEILRGALFLLYAGAAARAAWMLTHHRFTGTRRLAAILIGAVATGWAFYFGYVFFLFFGGPPSSHSLITEFGRTFHASNAVAMHLVLFAFAQTRHEDILKVIKEVVDG